MITEDKISEFVVNGRILRDQDIQQVVEIVHLCNFAMEFICRNKKKKKV